MILLFALFFCLLPNMLLIFGARKLQIAERLDTLPPTLAALSIATSLGSYLLVDRDRIWFPLFLACIGAGTAIIAIDYSFSRKDLLVKVAGIVGYYVVLVLCETIILGIVGQM